MEFLKRWAVNVAKTILIMAAVLVVMVIFLTAISSPVAFGLVFAGCILLIAALDAMEETSP